MGIEGTRGRGGRSGGGGSSERRNEWGRGGEVVVVIEKHKAGGKVINWKGEIDGN